MPEMPGVPFCTTASQYNRQVQPLIKPSIMASRSKDPEDDGRSQLNREDAMVVSLLMMRTSIEKSRTHRNLESLESHFTDGYKAQGTRHKKRHDTFGWC